MRGIGEAQPRAASAMILIGRPFRARIDGDASRQRRREQSLGVDLTRQFDPEKNAAFGIFEFGGGAELLVERSHQCFELGPQGAGEHRHMGVEMLAAKLAEHHLLQRARPGIGFEREHARQ